MNYIIKDIEDYKIERPDHTKIKFESLIEYLNMAQRMIKVYGPKVPGMSEDKLKQALRSEDAISEVAMKIMMGDYKYDESKGCNLYSFRVQNAIYGMQDYLNAFKTKKNRKNKSLNENVSLDDNVQLIDLIDDKSAVDPITQKSERESRDKTIEKVRFILKHGDLTEVQKKCLQFKYFGGTLDPSDEAIGKRFDPPITRQAVQQNIQRAFKKLKKVIK